MRNENIIFRLLPFAPLWLFTPFILGQVSCMVEVPAHEVTISAETPSAEVYVDEVPPPPREEVIVGVAPGPDYLWVGGYWTWRRSGWFWVGGRWAVRPRPGATWVAGSWERRGRGHVWISGRWR